MVKHRVALWSVMPGLLALAFAPAREVNAQCAPAPPASKAVAAPASLEGIVAPKQPTPTLAIDKVAIGMKGYGLTVFEGTKIESFPVEVVSVQRDFAPARGVIWIRCPDARMQKSGPVHGMSGSPIFLWDEKEPQELGKGGRLIGAFAFGFEATKDCYVGVQPIEHMREAGGRGGGDPKQLLQDANRSGATGYDRSGTLERFLAADTIRALPEKSVWRAKALRQLVRNGAREQATDVERPIVRTIAPGIEGKVSRTLLPVTVTTAGDSALTPLFASVGLQPMQMPVGAKVGNPPPGIDAQKIPIQPGSVLSIPLAWGDSDISAVGTVTDVLPDGRVLGFGHAMFGQGPTALPLASGYVHLVMPGLVSSFKMGGSGAVRGAIVRDENSAVVGRPDGKFNSGPAKYTIKMPGQPDRVYNYQVVQHRAVTPMIVAMLAIESLHAVQNEPLESTAKISGSITFAGGRKLDIDTVIPDVRPDLMMMEFLPPIAAMAQNPHESMMFESCDVTLTLEPTLLVGTLVSGRLERAEVAPGGTVGMVVKVQPYGKPAFDKRFEMTIPESMPEGDYELHACDTMTYLQMMMSTHPHLMNTTNADELFSMVKLIVSLPKNAVYLTMKSNKEGLAVGRQELPQLPSSRRAMIAAPTNTIATPYADSIEKVTAMDLVTEGDLSFTVSVKKSLKKSPKKKP